MESAAAVATAYGGGRMESAAAINLLTRVPKEVANQLKELVRLGNDEALKV